MSAQNASISRTRMSNKHIYVLGINAYDHDVSACLLRDGEIRVAINKERITRKKHDTGFYQKVVDYCLAASIWWCAIVTFCRWRIWNYACCRNTCLKLWTTRSANKRRTIRSIVRTRTKL